MLKVVFQLGTLYMYLDCEYIIHVFRFYCYCFLSEVSLKVGQELSTKLFPGQNILYFMYLFTMNTWVHVHAHMIFIFSENNMMSILRDFGFFSVIRERG